MTRIIFEHNGDNVAELELDAESRNVFVRTPELALTLTGRKEFKRLRGVSSLVHSLPFTWHK